MNRTDSSTRPYPLRSIYFYPTESCNLRCIHCWVHPEHAPDETTYQAQNRDNVSVGTMADVVQQALALGLQHIKLTGGEPMLNPWFFDYLESFATFNLNLSIETNATMLDDAAARRLRNFPIRHISTSLDGSTAEVHEGIRRVKGCFDQTVNGIRALTDNGFRPQVIFCLQQANAHTLEDTIRLAMDLNVKSFEINPLTLCGNGDGRRKGNTCRGLSISELLNVQRLVEEDYPERFTGITVNLYLPPALKGMRALVANNLCSCRIFNICGILSNGDVSVCGIGRRRKSLVMGNVARQPIEQIWRHGHLFQEIRRHVPHDLDGICGRCLFRFQCLGFCRADTLFGGQSVLEPNEFCQMAYQKGLFPKSRILNRKPHV